MSTTNFEPGENFDAFISEDFSNDMDPVRLACLKIYEFVSNQPKGQLRHLTFGLLRQSAGLSVEDSEILHKALGYLTGFRARLLLLFYEYIDPDTGEEFELSEEEAATFYSNGNFFHPRTGEQIPDPGENIYVFFRPNYAVFH